MSSRDEHFANEMMGIHVPRLVGDMVNSYPVRGWAFVATTGDVTSTESRNGFTFTIGKGWVNGDAQDAAHKVDVVVPVGMTIAANQLWLAASEEAAGHLTLLVRVA